MKKLGFGCMRLPQKDGEIDLDQFSKMVDTFLDRGFTYFDTSYVYHGGKSESALGKALVARHPRDQYTITTKSPVFMIDSKEKFFDIFNEQLKRLGTDYVDYYWLHAINGEQYQNVQKLGLVDALVQLKEQGKTRHIGMSYHDSPELLDQILTEHPQLEYVQLQLNYFDWESPYVQSRACYEVCKKHGKKVIVMEPVKGGELINLPQPMIDRFKAARPDLSVASWAIRFAASLDNVMVVLSGMSDQQQLDDNTSYMQDFQPLSDDESKLVDQTAKELRSNMTYDAAALASLAEAEKLCPKHIGLVKIAQMLNDHKRMHNDTNTCIYYDLYLGNTGKAADCDGCGKCLSAAGGIDVVAMLKEADDTITHF